MRMGDLRVGRLGSGAVVEEAGAARLPDRRRVGERPAVGVRLPDLDAGEGCLEARGDLAGDLDPVETAERRCFDLESWGPGKVRAVGAGCGEEREGIGGEG